MAALHYEQSSFELWWTFNYGNLNSQTSPTIGSKNGTVYLASATEFDPAIQTFRTHLFGVDPITTPPGPAGPPELNATSSNVRSVDIIGPTPPLPPSPVGVLLASPAVASYGPQGNNWIFAGALFQPMQAFEDTGPGGALVLQWQTSVPTPSGGLLPSNAVGGNMAVDTVQGLVYTARMGVPNPGCQALAPQQFVIVAAAYDINTGILAPGWGTSSTLCLGDELGLVAVPGNNMVSFNTVQHLNGSPASSLLVVRGF